MLGGSLFPVVVHALHERRPVNRALVQEDFSKLKEAGMGLGVHRDDHGHGSGCGFADNLLIILQTAKDRESEIREILGKVYIDNQDKIGLDEKYITRALDLAFAALRSYDMDTIEIHGDPLITVAEEAGASSETLTGVHGERVAFYNTEEGITFDTVAANNDGTQAFNIDRVAIHADCTVVGVDDPELIDGITLVTYIATEMVLVESKGKNRLPVVIN